MNATFFRALFVATLFITSSFNYTENITVVSSGIPGSGSTFVYRVCKFIGENIGAFNIKKRHGILSKDSLTDKKHIYLTTFRDPRDIVLCFANRLYKSNNPEFQARAYKRFGRIFKRANYINKLLESKDSGNKNIHFFKYEDFFCGNEELLVKKIIDVLYQHSKCGALLELNATDIANKFSLKSAKQIADKYSNFMPFDKESLIHGRHVTAEGRSTWRVYMPESLSSKIKEECCLYFDKFGYE